MFRLTLVNESDALSGLATAFEATVLVKAYAVIPDIARAQAMRAVADGNTAKMHAAVFVDADADTRTVVVRDTLRHPRLHFMLEPPVVGADGVAAPQWSALCTQMYECLAWWGRGRCVVARVPVVALDDSCAERVATCFAAQVVRLSVGVGFTPSELVEIGRQLGDAIRACVTDYRPDMYQWKRLGFRATSASAALPREMHEKGVFEHGVVASSVSSVEAARPYDAKWDTVAGDRRPRTGVAAGAGALALVTLLGSVAVWTRW